MPEGWGGGGGGLQDEVGNLESHVLTLGMRTQFKVHHPRSIRFLVGSYPPEQEFQAIWGKRMTCVFALLTLFHGSGEVCSLYIKLI